MTNSTFLKFLVGLSVFFAILPSYGQITISSSDVEPFVKTGGKYTSYHDATTKTVNIGTTGQTSWDFSGLVSTTEYVVKSEPVSTSAYAADFPDAQYVSYYETLVDGNYNKTWIYNSLGSEYVTNGCVVTGASSIGNITTKIKFSPLYVSYKFPIQMGYSNTYSGTQNFNSVVSIPGFGDVPNNSSQTVDETLTVDGYGVVTFPDGKKMDALRIKKVTTTTDSKGAKTILQYIIMTKSGNDVTVTPTDLDATSGNVSVSEIKWEILSDSQPTVTVSAPSQLNATPDKTQVVLSWTDNSTNETGFVIERAEGNSTNFTSVGTTLANVVTFSDNTAVAGIAYTYRIKAIGTNISSDYSNTSTATIPLLVSVIAPSELTAKVENNAIVLSWKDNASNETGFVVERSDVNSANFTLLASLGANVQTYTDNSAGANMPYTYRVKAVSDQVSSDFSNNVFITIPLVVVKAPSGLTVTAGSTVIVLKWTDNSTNETGFVIERAEGNSTKYTALASLDANATTYSDANVTAGVNYTYRVKAIGSNSVSDFSNIATSVIQVIEVVNAPSGLTATVGSDVIVLSWKDNATNETGFVVERAEGNSTNFTSIGTTLADVVTYSDKSVTAGIAYTYRIKATGASSNSEYSTNAGATIVTSAIEISESNPVLVGNYPNPMTSSTRISFYMPRRENVTIEVYDLSGKSMEKLADRQFEQGKHEVILERKGLKSGVYLYSIFTSDYKQTRKLIVE